MDSCVISIASAALENDQPLWLLPNSTACDNPSSSFPALGCPNRHADDTVLVFHKVHRPSSCVWQSWLLCHAYNMVRMNSRRNESVLAICVDSRQESFSLLHTNYTPDLLICVRNEHHEKQVHSCDGLLVSFQSSSILASRSTSLKTSLPGARRKFGNRPANRPAHKEGGVPTVYGHSRETLSTLHKPLSIEGS